MKLKSDPILSLVDSAKVVSAERSTFGGCGKLYGQYSIIGKELLTFENNGGFYSLTVSNKTHADFQSGLAFIPVEVLESYFDDLLDLTITEEHLHIRHVNWLKRWGIVWFAAITIAFSFMSGLYLASTGAPISLAFSLAVALALPGSAVLYFSSSSPVRRMHFAQLLTREISRRRGNLGNTNVIRGSAFQFKSLLNPQQVQGVSPISRIQTE